MYNKSLTNSLGLNEESFECAVEFYVCMIVSSPTLHVQVSYMYVCKKYIKLHVNTCMYVCVHDSSPTLHVQV